MFRARIYISVFPSSLSLSFSRERVENYSRQECLCVAPEEVGSCLFVRAGVIMLLEVQEDTLLISIRGERGERAWWLVTKKKKKQQEASSSSSSSQ